MNDRIRLAEAMGWSTDGNGNWRTSPYDPDVECSGWISKSYLPDPFTDANDDYAVLEWMREHVFPVKGIPSPELRQHLNSYQIGDYARAALKVIDDE